jgi:hypothetical protein
MSNFILARFKVLEAPWGAVGFRDEGAQRRGGGDVNKALELLEVGAKWSRDHVTKSSPAHAARFVTAPCSMHRCKYRRLVLDVLERN